MILTAGTRLGPYEILAPLGAGGMGEVYKARDTRLDRTVAIKILPADVATNGRRRERFRREARAISSLTHPHICTLHDIGEQGGLDFLVMEYLPGETLAHRLLRSALPLEEVLRIAIQLAEALDAAHSAGLIHRDLKPANVMLTASGAKVLDFGLAKWHGSNPDSVNAAAQATANPTLTQVGSVVGTIQYMAPEQIEGKPADVRSDIFALGAVLYEMTTGRKAFEGDGATSVIAAILTATPPPMATLQPMTPRDLERVVRKCLAKDPARRWQAVSDLRDELAWIAEGITDRAPVASLANETRQLSGSWRRWLAWPLAVAAVVLTLLVLAFLFRTAPPAPAAMRFAVLPPEKTTGADVPIVSPDGGKLAFVARTEDGKSSLWVRSFDSLESRAIADADDLAFPFWSADGHFIAFFAHNRLNRVDATGGAVQVICDAPSGRGGAWNRDGVIVFAPTAEGPLFRVSASGGIATQLTTLDTATADRSHRFPQFLADGRRFVYSVYFSRGRPVIKVASLDSTDTTQITTSSFGRAWAPPGYLVFQREQSGPYLAQPFDQNSLRLTGEALPIVDRAYEGPVVSDTALSVSNNGVLAYEATIGEPLIELTWRGRAGQRLGQVEPRGAYEQFSLSPDGRRVAVVRRDPQTRGTDIWVIEVSRGAMSRVTSDGRADAPVWSPDGDRIAFSSDRLGGGYPDLYSVKWNGIGRREEPVLTSNQYKFLWDWSRDGRILLFGANDNPAASGNLWFLSLISHDKPRPFVETVFSKGNARFSPDTRWVAYDSDESPRREVYVQSFPEAAARVQVSSAGGSEPRWRRDGKELFYIGADHKLMALTVHAAATFEAGPPATLFDVLSSESRINRGPAGQDDFATSYDVDADGQRFLIPTVLQAPTRSPLTVILNWTTALKK